MSKKCPITTSYCIEERCQWWREYDADCAIGVVADKLLSAIRKVERSIDCDQLLDWSDYE